MRQVTHTTDLLSLNQIGQSRSILDVVDTVRRIANYDTIVSIFDETGIGKELIASALHYSISSNSGPFIPCNCGALQDSLFESELFGHEKDAFTNAYKEHAGLIELADHGTLYLDKISILHSLSTFRIADYSYLLCQKDKYFHQFTTQRYAVLMTVKKTSHVRRYPEAGNWLCARKGASYCICILLSILPACSGTKHPMTWQQRRLDNPTKLELQWERNNHVMIYESMKDYEVEHALDNHFDRVESMMFINTVITDEHGDQLKDPETGKVITETDGCD
jgi:hypothetical protein